MKEQLFPNDEHDQLLTSHVHPPNWRNPEPACRYNLAVIGAGTAGLVTAAGAAGLGARVALIERGLMGGDCLNFGCVPSKALIRSARAAASVREAEALGIHIPGNAEVDFSRVMERVRRLRSQISVHDSAQRYRELGVDVFFGQARFQGRTTLNVEDKELRFQKAVIATGSRPSIPAIPGLKADEFLTNETIFSLNELPRRLAVIGGGPLGCELAQAFGRLGSKVTVIEQGPHLLPREDSDAADLLARVFAEEGISLYLGTRVTRVSTRDRARIVQLSGPSGDRTVESDQLLVATGRQPNTEDLDLTAAGVRSHRGKILVNERLQTTNARIYVAGDVGFEQRFTHAADATARLVIENALFFGNRKAGALTIPWCTYTSPEIARVGLSETEAERQKLRTTAFKIELASVDRALLDGQTAGFAKLIVRKGADQILGATIVADHAGEMINELTLAIDSGLGLKNLAALIHPYPTQSEAVRKAADAYQRTRLTPLLRRLLRVWFRILR